MSAISIFANRRLRGLLTCVLVAGGAAFAQRSKAASKEIAASEYQLAAINATGSHRYRPEDIAAGTALQIGQTVHEDDFKDAARLLADSGAFSDVAYSFSYSEAGTKVEFQVKDSADFVPAYFENFVWLSDQDLAKKLHAQVPLFHGELPVRGGLADQVSLALQSMLIDLNVEGSADYTRVGAEDGPTKAFDFSVTGPHIVIRDVKFPGSEASVLPQLQASARSLSGRAYSRGTIRDAAEKQFLPFYLQKGYLKATLGEPEASVVKSDPEETDVEVTFHAVSGPQYKLAGVSISGNKAFPAETLRKLIPAQIDQPVNVVAMQDDVAAMQALYGTRGFMAAAIKTGQETDDKTLSVRYTLSITEGDVYKMGELDIRGLDSPTTARMQTLWMLRSGDTYNSDYPHQFAKQVNKDRDEWAITIHESVNPQDKTVDVSLRFNAKG